MDDSPTGSNVSNEKQTKSVNYRLITSIIFFASLSMCIYQTYQLILIYVSDPIDTEIKVILHDTIQFPSVTICNINPVRRSRWQEKTNKSYTKTPQSSSSMQEPQKLRHRSIRSHSATKTDINFSPNSLMTGKREKRQAGFVSNSYVDLWLATLDKQVDDIEKRLAELMNNYTHQQDFTSHVNKSRECSELETRLNDLEKRLEVTEMTTAEITNTVAETRSYLDRLKANMSEVNEENAAGDNTVTEMEKDGKKVLPPSKDLQAFRNYLKDIGTMRREDFEELGNQKEHFIASCRWQGTICDPSHFEVFQNYLYGNCFTFNTTRVNSDISGTGPYNGLSLSLFIEQEEYMDRIAPAAGARVVIHEFHFKPLPEEDGFWVAPGFTTAISLRKFTTETVKPICDPDAEMSKRNDAYSYSQKGCLKKCLSDEIIRQCHCAGTQFFLDIRTCSVDNETEAGCVERLEGLARKNKLPCYCPLACRTTVYNPIISSAVWPAEKYLPSLLEELVRVRHKVIDIFESITDVSQYFRKNFLRINIFFQELKEQETIQRHSYGLASLLSDIGGQMGLWVGVSVITLVDFTESLSMFIKVIYREIKQRMAKKSNYVSNAPGSEDSSHDDVKVIDRKNLRVYGSPTLLHCDDEGQDSSGSVTIQTFPIT